MTRIFLAGVLTGVVLASGAWMVKGFTERVNANQEQMREELTRIELYLANQ